MKSISRSRLVISLACIVLIAVGLTRCTTSQSKSTSVEQAIASPTVSKSEVSISPSSEPSPEVKLEAKEDIKPSSAPSSKPKKSSKATLSVKTIPSKPTAARSTKPTDDSREPEVFPAAPVENDFDGDGLPDYIAPTVTFNASCEVTEDKYIYKSEANISGGDNYQFFSGGLFTGWQMKLVDGKFWFSWPESDRGYYPYKIRSVTERSWTYVDWWVSKKSERKWDVELGSKWIRQPLTLSHVYTNASYTFPRPDIDYSLCRR